MKSYFRLALLSSVLYGCASVQESSRSPMVDYALTLKGTPYHYGKNSPEDGFDCSGFVQYVYKRQGITLPRTVQGMTTKLPSVTRNDLLPGDLVFFNTNGKPYSHVGIYIDNDDFIHAPSQRTGKVLVSSLKNKYWNSHYSCARRP